MNAHTQNGLSLIEVMVALVISTILVLGVTDLFNSAFMSGRSNSELAQVQESGRLAMEIIGADARLAGLQTCTTNNWSSDKAIEDAVVLENNGKSITLRYKDPKNCDDDKAALSTVRYDFANNSLSKTENGAKAPLLDNIDGSFALLPDGNQPGMANALQVNLSVQSEQTGFSARAFSSIYEFKNRLIAKD